jgi:hypothetical protein
MDHILMNPFILNTGASKKIDHLVEKSVERAFKTQNLARHEPECLMGCAAYEKDHTFKVAR